MPFDTSLSQKKVKLCMMDQQIFFIHDDDSNKKNSICNQNKPTKSILFRQDYVKPNIGNNNYIKAGKNTSSTVTTLANENGNFYHLDSDYLNKKLEDKQSSNSYLSSTTNNINNETSNLIKISSKCYTTSNRKSARSNKVQNENLKSQIYKNNLAVSPNSQKKDELCAYLQLVNTSVPKNNELLQNRRSIRVLNHQELMQKRKIEKVLNSSALKDKKSGDASSNLRSSTRKSFAELESFMPTWKQKNGTDGKNHVVKVKEFDSVMQNFVQKEKLPCKMTTTTTRKNNENFNGINQASGKSEDTCKILGVLKKNYMPSGNEKLCDQFKQYLSKYNKPISFNKQPSRANYKCEREKRCCRRSKRYHTKAPADEKYSLAQKKERVIQVPMKRATRFDYVIVDKDSKEKEKTQTFCKNLNKHRNNWKMNSGENNNDSYSLKVLEMLQEKLKKHFEVISMLTPEHRKALFDSIKFVDENQMNSFFMLTMKEILGSFDCLRKEEDVTCSLKRVMAILERQMLEKAQGKCKLKEFRKPNSQKEFVKRKTVNRAISLTDSNTIKIDENNDNQCNIESSNNPSKNPFFHHNTLNTTTTNENNVNSSSILSPILSYVAFPSNTQTTRCASLSVPGQTNCSSLGTVFNSVLFSHQSTNNKSLNSYLSRKKRAKISLDLGLQVCENYEDEEPVVMATTTTSSNKYYVQNCLQSVQSVTLCESKGPVERAFYFDFALVVVQELFVSFWKVCPLGNVLGAHDMWEAKGDIHRLVSDDSTDKTVAETVTYSDKSVAYFEMWTKINNSSTLDLIVVIYFWLECFSRPNRKIVLLDNLKCENSDVCYVVLKRIRKILVGTFTVVGNVPTTFICCYHLASDFQSIACSKQVGCINYRLMSMHNIQDCDTLIMGCGDQKITLWNVEHGFMVATIDLLGINENPQTLWSKCDRGFLFVLQQFLDGSLKLIAINGINYTWKLLRSFEPSSNYGSLYGVCIENGILVAFFDNVAIAWKMENREEILELTCGGNIKIFVSDNNVISISNKRVQVKNALQYLLTSDDMPI